MNIKKIAALICVSAFFSLCVFAAEVHDPAKLDPNDIQKMRLISEAYLKMQMRYYKPIPLERLEQLFYRNQVIAGALIKNNKYDFEKKLDIYIYGTLQWMVKELKDPTDQVSKFIHKDYLKQVLRENVVSKFKGIGIEVEDRKEGFFVSMVYKKSSALEEGVRVNDRILMIDQKDISSSSFKEVETLLNIPSGETVTLSLVHEGETEVVEVTLTSRIIVIPSVTAEYYDLEKAAYIRISEFRENTAQEVKDHLNKLLENECDSLIIDMRDNDGGDVEQAIALCDLFLPKDTLVCYFLKRDVGRQDQRTVHDPLMLAGIKKIIILVNKNTASSAEITAGALRHYDTCTVIGTQTKGLGAFKNTVGLSDGSALYIITSRTYLPDDTTFDGGGIAPDIIIDDPEEQLTRALQMVA